MSNKLEECSAVNAVFDRCASFRADKQFPPLKLLQSVNKILFVSCHQGVQTRNITRRLHEPHVGSVGHFLH